MEKCQMFGLFDFFPASASLHKCWAKEAVALIDFLQQYIKNPWKKIPKITSGQVAP